MTFVEADLSSWSMVVGEPAISAVRSTGQRLGTRIENISQLLSVVGAKRVLLVVDRQAVTAASLAEALAETLAGCHVFEFDEIAPNPSSEQLAAAARCANEWNADTVVAVGGGSTLDTAKFAALAGRLSDEINAMSRGKLPHEIRPLNMIAVPTTSGSGSEATHFAVAYDDGRKISIAHPAMRPAAVVLDPRFHAAMPRRLAAVTGLDALAQSLESLWAVGATPQSNRFAELAAQLIVPSLVESVQSASVDARLRVMLGAHLAGQAINLSKTTAAHALSYGISTAYNVPHGHAVALTLGWVAALNHDVENADCCDPRGADDVRRRVRLAAAQLHCAPAEMPKAVHSLLELLGLPATLGEVGVGLDGIRALAASVDGNRLSNNPRRLDQAQIERLLERALVAPEHSELR